MVKNEKSDKIQKIISLQTLTTNTKYRGPSPNQSLSYRYENQWKIEKIVFEGKIVSFFR